MKYLAVIKTILAIVAIGALSGCGKPEVSVPNIDIPPEQYQAPTNCVNLSGRWLMNNDYFSIEQTKCEKLLHINLDTNLKTLYLADKMDREYILANGNRMRESSYFTETQFIINRMITTPAGAVSYKTLKYYLSKRPCNLMNPDGEDYLTVDVYLNGAATPNECDFWAKI